MLKAFETCYVFVSCFISSFVLFLLVIDCPGWRAGIISSCGPAKAAERATGAKTAAIGCYPLVVDGKKRETTMADTEQADLLPSPLQHGHLRTIQVPGM